MVQLIGSAVSTYARSARLVLAEKGVEYTLVPARMRSEDYPHPWRKMPVLDHDGFILYEAIAILTYIDTAFAGPPLQPEDAKGRARMLQWMSAFNDYVAPFAVRGVLIPRFVWPSMKIEVDEDKVKKSVATAHASLARFDAALATSPFLAGDAPSLADWLLLPVIAADARLPDADQYAGGYANLARWHATLAARPSFAATGVG